MAFPTTPVLDDFNRPDEEPVTGFTDMVNGIQLEGGGGADDYITGDTGDANNVAGYTTPKYGPNCEAYMTMEGNLCEYIGVYARLTTLVGGTFDGYSSFQNPNDNTQLYRIDDGVGTQIGTDYSFTAADGDKIGIECIGTTIKAYIKDGAAAWGEVKSATDSNYQSDGYLGLSIYSWSAAERAGDDFGGGTIAAVGAAGIMTTNTGYWGPTF